VSDLPPGWRWAKVAKGLFRIVTDTGVQVPLADNPDVGSDEERAALQELLAWQETVRDA
jgi:hypothetical protein